MQPTQSKAPDDLAPSKSSLQVLVANQTDAAVDADRIETAVRFAFAGSPYQSVNVSVAIVDDETIHQLNRQFLDHDYPTDVLSFALEDDPPRLEGEIVVSVDTARRCALEAGWPPESELLLYAVHGALHLAGFGDKNPQDALEMRTAEARLLAQLDVPISPSDNRWGLDAANEEPSS